MGISRYFTNERAQHSKGSDSNNPDKIMTGNFEK